MTFFLIEKVHNGQKKVLKIVSECSQLINRDYLINSNYGTLCTAHDVSFIKREGRTGARISVQGCDFSQTDLLLDITLTLYCIRNNKFGLIRSEVKENLSSALRKCLTPYSLKVNEGKI